MDQREKRLRIWLKDNIKKHSAGRKLHDERKVTALFVEHGMGGTEGIPDVIIHAWKFVAFVELKALPDSKIRNSQKKVITDLLNSYLNCCIMCWADENEEEIILTQNLEGKHNQFNSIKFSKDREFFYILKSAFRK